MAFFNRSRRPTASAAPDPDLARFHRGRAATNAQPPGDLGQGMNAAQVTTAARQIRQQFESGQLDALWERRLQLGNGVSYDGVADVDAFWLNAAPAIAALRLGVKDHVFVPMCCGLAERYHDIGDASQSAAVREFQVRYFGAS
jgi:hypothetical protein